MPKGRALKEEMMMQKKDMPQKKQMMKSKDGFPAMPMKDKMADDLGYFTKPKRLKGK